MQIVTYLSAHQRSHATGPVACFSIFMITIQLKVQVSTFDTNAIAKEQEKSGMAGKCSEAQSHE